ncbi:Protein-glutamate methylesterase/protein-glutamine glutaminase [Pseudoalteromonas holothuriae]|uniref:Protein-glutamate methylesterase/protein-glutamine glutaminase n=1 Tax=Pseudoalteromonas holothuriae TaxID=2963714 RepID=A0A9W4QVP9_9GAMM|nr:MULTISPECIES: response regulator [unclassified Pseudoalteromonas]CAH9053825.1 Protein-glutamate methylesterase/protein-glutamine glutaminase [Pseudoalteromonas sp. CIP111951]CAH9055790.1 Protein-glutamate methylesterase/protein-glutamine glutaminase [Pseudoalteromonas sp. CIP111854]
MSKLVLAIDDDKLAHCIIEEALASSCRLLHAKSGEEGIRLAQKYQPDIILLDVEMPGMNGFEVCEKMKTIEQTANIPVMFLSSKGSLCERMRGYNSGAADYIVKPFESPELLARIEVLDTYRQQSQQLKQDMERAQVTAEIAMTDSGDMGRIMRYVGQSYHAHDLTSLSEYFFEFFVPLNLSVAVVFWYHDSEVFFSHNGTIQPIEQELLEKHRDSNRFVDFGQRTIINYPKVSLLVKNMPIDDPGLYGRYKDLLPHILEATNAKIKDMEVSEDALNKVEKIGLAFEELSEQLHSVDEQHALKVAEFLALSHKMKSQLSPEQAAQIEKLHGHFEFLDGELTVIKEKLNGITVVRFELIESLNKIAKPWGEDEVASQTDIELF